MQHFFRDVPRLGHVAVSRHAQARCEEESISEDEFRTVLLEPLRPDVPDGMSVVWRERGGVRLVIETNPAPNRGAKLVTTVYRVHNQLRVIP